MLTASRLREVLDYCPETGRFLRLPRTDNTRAAGIYNAKYAGKEPGYVCPRGFVEISVDKKIYRAHRLAWLFVHGEWPEHEVDHANGNTTDNRFCNLRAATRQENARNTRTRSHSRSGLKGACWHKKTQKWQARISINGRFRSLGYYDTAEEAHEAFCREARRLYGEFFRAA